MLRKPARNRRRYRLSLEQCEPREMLSVAPPAPPTELVSQLQIYYQSPQGALDTFALDSGPLITSKGGTWRVLNAYGGVVNSSAGGSLIHFSAETNGIRGHVIPRAGGFLGGMSWQRIPAPTIDLISFLDPIAPPQDSSRPEEVFAPKPIAAPVPIAAPRPTMTPNPIAAPAPIAPEPVPERADFPAPSTVDAKGNGRRWLPVTFTPLEQHRMDALTLDAHDALAVATHDPQSRSALEPTRVTCQTFCVIAHTQMPASNNGAEFLSTSAPEHEENGAGNRQSFSPLEDEARAEPGSEANLPAVHDATILEWEDPRKPSVDGQSPAARSGQRIAAPQRSSGDTGHALADGKSRPRQVAAQLLGANMDFVAPLLATIAMGTLAPYRASDTEETQLADPRVSLARKRRNPLHPSEG